MKYFWILLLSTLTIGCNQTSKEKKDASTDEKNEMIPVEPNGGIGDGALSIIDSYIESVAIAHKKKDFLKHKVVSFNTSIYFGGKLHLDGKITMLTNASKIRIDKKDESKLIYTGEKVFLCPENASDKGARFDMFTWTYFFGMPYKLNDPGTQWKFENNRTLDGIDHPTAKLTFAPGTGDAPDDWYVIYTNPKDNTLQAAAYIVTFGSQGDISKAEADPHAIRYKNFTQIDGIPFATKWEFYGWNKEKGIADQLIGEATITDITFLDEEGELFDNPNNAKEIKL